MNKACDPSCKNCKGGAAQCPLFKERRGGRSICAVCGGDLISKDEQLREECIVAKVVEAKKVFRSYEAQFNAGDSMRSFSLRRLQGIIGDILDMEAGKPLLEGVAAPDEVPVADGAGND